jgi:peptide/nickel transport system substrate-binding protein
MEFRHPNLPLREFDQAKAREYLEASVWNGEEIEIAVTLATVADGLVMVQHQLGQVGIPVTINRMDTSAFGAYATYADNQSQLVAHSATMELNASSIRPHLMPGGALNRASYNNPSVTGLLEAAGTMTDANARRAAYIEVQEIVHEEIPFFAFIYREFMAAAVPGIGGITFSTNMTHDLRYIFWDLDE